MADEPSTGAGVTPPPVPPATGTPAPGSATPPAASLTTEELLKRIADLEHSQKNATEEVERHRKKLTAYEKTEAEREAAKRAAEEAQLSEIERTKKQHADIQAERDRLLAELQETRIHAAIGNLATKLGIIDPDAAAKLLEWSEIDYEDGKPKNLEKLLEALIQAKPYLKAPEQTQAAPSPAQSAQQASPPALPAMNQGRTNIAPPGSLTPGKVPSLAEAYARTGKRR